MKPTDIKGLYGYLSHGDDDHKAWLKEAIEAYFDNKPVPPIKGSGNKEALIKKLQDENKQLKEELDMLEDRLNIPFSLKNKV